MKYPGIYCIRFGLNERIYIGSAMNCSRRKSQHLYKLRRNLHDNPKLQNYYNKYGEELLSFQIIESMVGASLEEVRKKEQKYLNKYFAQEYINSAFSDKRFDELLLNVTPEVNLMRVHWTEERKKLLIERNKTFIWTDDMRKHMSKIKKGKLISKEDKEKRLQSCEKHRQKIRNSRNVICTTCGSNKTRKVGTRLNKTENILMQRFKCLECSKSISIKIK
jgi:group I intron endonuclease